ncbi:FecCD family ABC transporter permease [Hahella ganghwensis]|uniref:FecCD family ABC transporter permease n=1 Tax=Hahella ganghwensis TaxID=286420 RepID=UPI000370C73F|nr:iron ABC transporter permease [Hahella ganghwensis]
MLRSFRSYQLLIALLMLATAFSASIVLGQTSISLKTAYQAFTQYDPTVIDHIIITTTRLSRALTAIFVGSALAVAGALMQALTRNPLASPGILGINAGALFGIVLSATLFSVASLQYYVWIAFTGAGIAGGMVYCLGAIGRDGLTPVKLVLAGAAITALFVSFTQGLLVVNQEGLDSILFWLAGSVAGRSLEIITPVLPFITLMLVASLLLGRHINILISGEDVARGLGQRTVMMKWLMGLIVVGLAGSAVAIAGNIAFVGLIVPHMARAMFGTDYRWMLPGCAMLGATLLLAADIMARFLIMPQEVPIGVMTALLGTPFFIFLARRGMTSGKKREVQYG